ncbi:MAG: hypothetical protein JWR12_2866 [Mucilaginibacter sp.]|nr:hypothetical protein [Mucilaginibacter sp.]
MGLMIAKNLSKFVFLVYDAKELPYYYIAKSIRMVTISL